MTREVVRSVFLGLGLLGLVLSAHGAWIPAKAWVAQHLLERAWHRAGAGERTPRPWPWADTWPIARLRAPAQNVSLMVLEGASGPTLAFGPGRHPLGAPVSGLGNVVLAGHRDTAAGGSGHVVLDEQVAQDAVGILEPGDRHAAAVDLRGVAPHQGALDEVLAAAFGPPSDE